MKKTFLLLSMVAFVIGVVGTSLAELHDRGGGMIYDDVMDITWLQDANYAMTSGYDSDGLMLWQDAMDWADQLVYGGYDDWRLPTTLRDDSSCSGCPTCNPDLPYGYNCIGSEMGHLFYEELGGVAGQSIYDVHNENYNLFINMPDPADPIERWRYWSSTEEPLFGNQPWVLAWENGSQDVSHKTLHAYSAWAVRDGDVGPAVPTLSCIGFEPPFDDVITLKKKDNRAIPVKMVLVDDLGDPITDENISAPPVVNVEYEPFSGVVDENNPELVPPGLADDGNAFRFDPTSEQWIINLSTKQFSSAGTYTVTVEPGDSNYLINTCTQVFTRPE